MYLVMLLPISMLAEHVVSWASQTSWLRPMRSEMTTFFSTSVPPQDPIIGYGLDGPAMQAWA
jgi:hypothetical protein